MLQAGYCSYRRNLKAPCHSSRYPSIKLDAKNASIRAGGAEKEGDVIVEDRAGREVIHLNGSNAAVYVGASGNEGDVIVRDNQGRDVLHLNGSSAAAYVGATGNEGDVIVRDGAGRHAIHLNGSSAALHVGTSGNEGDVVVYDGEGREVIHLNGSNAALSVGGKGNEGDILVHDGNGEKRIHLDGKTGDIRLFGADCAEQFSAVADDIEPGTVLVTGEDGVLTPCVRECDTRVIGVVAGAGEYTPGIVLDGIRRYPHNATVSLAGKTFCKVDASYGAVGVGDLLTTSNTKGHARVADKGGATAGAVLGKALGKLDEGRGLVLIVPMLG